jgi:quercetin dioxygenase-like cupin family protein
MRMRSKVMLAGLLALVLVAGALGAQSAATHTVDDPSLQWGGCPEFLPAGCQIAVLNGDPAQPNADVFFRVPAQSHIARHWHSSAERMVLVAGELEVSYDGAETVTLRPGTYAYGPARAPHEARCLSAEPCVLFIAFEGPVDAIAGDPPDA